MGEDEDGGEGGGVAGASGGAAGGAAVAGGRNLKPGGPAGALPAGGGGGGWDDGAGDCVEGAAGDKSGGGGGGGGGGIGAPAPGEPPSGRVLGPESLGQPVNHRTIAKRTATESARRMMTPDHVDFQTNHRSKKSTRTGLIVQRSGGQRRGATAGRGFVVG